MARRIVIVEASARQVRRFLARRDRPCLGCGQYPTMCTCRIVEGGPR